MLARAQMFLSHEPSVGYALQTTRNNFLGYTWWSIGSTSRFRGLRSVHHDHAIRSQASRPADRRSQLIERAADLFVQRGYPHVSMADIARAAGSPHRRCTGISTTSATSSAPPFFRRRRSGDVHRSRSRTAILLHPRHVAGAFEALAKRPLSASLWRWTGAYLSDEQNREVALRTRAVLRRWADALLGPASGRGRMHPVSGAKRAGRPSPVGLALLAGSGVPS